MKMCKGKSDKSDFVVTQLWSLQLLKHVFQKSKSSLIEYGGHILVTTEAHEFCQNSGCNLFS